MALESISAWLFPGQGSQYLGMGRDLWAQDGRATEIAEEAERLSGFPLREICRQGPDEELRRTDVLQPALTAVSLGCVAMLEGAGFRASMVAGHSLGEFAALCAAGVISVTDCLRLVSERGRLMQAAARQLNGGMGAVKRLAPERLSELMATTDAGLCIANYNSPEQVAISGTLDALENLAPKIAGAGGEYVPLPVAGPWHSPSMSDAAKEFAAFVDSVKFAEPRIPVFMNASGRAETDAARIQELVRSQMTAPVLWQLSVGGMFAAGATLFLEVGPGKVLRGLLRRILPDESRYRVRGVENKRALELLASGAAV